MPLITIALLIAAALGGSTAVAAQQSLPGDLLWGFKTNINESVAGALNGSTQAQANWNIATIRTRFAEAQALEAQGAFNAAAQADVAANFNEHFQAAKDAIAHMQLNGQSGAAADAATRLQAEVAQFISLNTGAQAGTGLGDAVRSAINTASQLSAQASQAASAELYDIQ